MDDPTAPGQFRSMTTVHNVRIFLAFVLVSPRVPNCRVEVPVEVVFLAIVKLPASPLSRDRHRAGLAGHAPVNSREVFHPS